MLSSALHAGQRSAKPGLSGLSSNSSEQMLQIFMGKATGQNLKRIIAEITGETPGLDFACRCGRLQGTTGNFASRPLGKRQIYFHVGWHSLSNNLVIGVNFPDLGWRPGNAFCFAEREDSCNYV